MALSFKICEQRMYENSGQKRGVCQTIDLRVMYEAVIFFCLSGFICPVHTPDGAPCGLLNHLAAGCDITCKDGPTDAIFAILHNYGLIDLDELEDFIIIDDEHDLYPVFLNGKMIGYMEDGSVKESAIALRKAKTLSIDDNILSRYTEIVLLQKTEFRNLSPALYIFTNSGRMMRPVRNLYIRDQYGQQTIEYVGTFEQIYMNIAVVPEEFEEGVRSSVKRESLAPYTAHFSVSVYDSHGTVAVGHAQLHREFDTIS